MAKIRMSSLQPKSAMKAMKKMVVKNKMVMKVMKKPDTTMKKKQVVKIMKKPETTMKKGMVMKKSESKRRKAAKVNQKFKKHGLAYSDVNKNKGLLEIRSF
jgi:hypothetical protein